MPIAITGFDFPDVPNSSIEFEYFNRVEPANPSGAANIKRIIYKKNDMVFLEQWFEWTADNKIKKIYTKP